MNSRPRDVCTAAFNGDTARLEQLAVAAGVYGGRWHSPFALDTGVAAREALAQLDGAGDGAEEDAAGGDAELEEEMTELLGEAEVAKLAANPALCAVVKAYSLDKHAAAQADGSGAASPVASATGRSAGAGDVGDGEGPADGGEAENAGDEEDGAGAADADDGAAGDDEDDDDGFEMDEEAQEAAEADRQAQLRDFALFKRLLAHQQHRRSIAERLQQHGLLHMSTTPPVDMTSYGILFSCREVPAGAAASAGDGVALQVRWQPSRRSRYAGTPLHWAVLAREHDTIRYLVEHGVTSECGLKALAVDGSAAGDGAPVAAAAAASAAAPSAELKVLEALTPATMAAANASHATLDVLQRAVAAQAARLADEEAYFTALADRLRLRKERYRLRREQARALRQLEADEAARRAEAEEAEEAEEDAEDDADDADEGDYEEEEDDA